MRPPNPDPSDLEMICRNWYCNAGLVSLEGRSYSFRKIGELLSGTVSLKFGAFTGLALAFLARGLNATTDLEGGKEGLEKAFTGRVVVRNGRKRRGNVDNC